jgi:hypothetical protein
MDIMCPVCHKKVKVVVDPTDPSKLAGFCAHFPGALPRNVFSAPNPDYNKAPEPVKPVHNIVKRSTKK